MDADVQAVIAPVNIAIESETVDYKLGPAAREALRIEQIQELRGALDAITDYANGEPLDCLLRAQLEDLGLHLQAASAAASAVWWLIPADVYTEDE